MEGEGFEDMEDYVLKTQNTVAQNITTRPIMDLWKETVRRYRHDFLGYVGSKRDWN